MAYIVTGGQGYIGRHLVELIRSELGQDLIVLDKFSGNNELISYEGYKVIQCDISEPLQIRELQELSGVSGIFHMAALKSVSESLKFEKRYYDVNVSGTQNILDLAIKLRVKNLVFTSSAAVYGGSDSRLKVKENAPTQPLNPYGKTKLQGEELFKIASEVHGINYFNLRIFNAGGVKVPGSLDRFGENVIPILFRALQTGDAFNIYGDKFSTQDGSSVRDFVHVQDIAKAHLLAMKYLESGQVSHPPARNLNISSGNGTSIFEIIKLIEDISGKKLKVNIREPRKGDPDSVVGDNSLANSILGWKPIDSIEGILGDTHLAFRDI